MTTSKKHRQAVHKAFSSQAERFGEKGLTLSSEEYLEWMVNLLPLEPSFRVLDVAAGTGHLARAIAPRVREVAAVDATPRMLEQAAEEAARAGLKNIVLHQAAAERLPFGDSVFDLAASRLAIHHFETPAEPLAEKVRVCKPGRLVAVIDLLAPDDPGLARTCNRLERLRDPSHVEALPRRGLVRLMQDAGLVIRVDEARTIEVNTGPWFRVAATGAGEQEQVRKALEAELAGGEPTGMRPLRKDKALHFLQTWAVIAGEKRR